MNSPPVDYQKLAQVWQQVATNQGVQITNLTAELTLIRADLQAAQQQLAKAPETAPEATD